MLHSENGEETIKKLGKLWTFLRPGTRAERAMNRWVSFSRRFLSAITWSWLFVAFLMTGVLTLWVPGPDFSDWPWFWEITDAKFMFPSSFGLTEESRSSGKFWISAGRCEFEFPKEISWEEEDEDALGVIQLEVEDSQLFVFNCFAVLSTWAWKFSTKLGVGVGLGLKDK